MLDAGVHTSTLKQPDLTDEQVEAEIARFKVRLQDLPSGKIWRAFEQLHRILIFLASTFIVLAISAMVVMRYILDTDLFGIEEFILLASFVLYFMGGAQGSFERSHITADFLEKVMAKRGWLGRYLLIQRGLELVINFIFIYWGYLMLSWSIAKWPITPVWRIPFALPQGFIAFGFLLMALYSTVHYIIVIRTVLATRQELS